MSKTTSLATNSLTTQHSLVRPIVIHVISGLHQGGIESLCLQLIQHAPSHVRNILLNLDPTHQEMLPQFQQIPGLTIAQHHIAIAPRHRFVQTLQSHLKSWQPQAVLIYPFGLHVFVGLAARLAGVPVVAVHAGNPPPQVGQSDRWKWRVLIGLSQLLNIPIYSCSHATHQAFSDLMPLPRGSVPIPNGCDVADIAHRATLSRRSRPETDQIIIGMVARLNTIKDQATLIRAFAQLRKTRSNVQLWLVGDGSERHTLEGLCDRLGLTDNVKFWGARSDVPELLGQMDIYAFSTTENEGFGIALIEAMAASLPIVASRVEACQEVLHDGEAGMLVPAQDANAMATALEQFVQFPQQRAAWGQRAYNRVAKQYSIQTCAHQWYGCLLNNWLINKGRMT